MKTSTSAQPGTARYLRDVMAQRPIVGIWSLLNAPVAMDVIGRAGFDFVVIDQEHGPSSTVDCYQLAAMARSHGTAPIMRLPCLSQRFTQQALDWGAAGIKVPSVSSQDDVATFESYVRFPPRGLRGLSPFVANAGFDAAGAPSFCASRRAEELYILQIENKAGLDCADAMLAADIDVLFVGQYDLSRSLGETVDSPVLDGILADLAQRCAAAGKALGTIASSERQMRRHIDIGARYVTYLADTHILLDALRTVRSMMPEG